MITIQPTNVIHVEFGCFVLFSYTLVLHLLRVRFAALVRAFWTLISVFGVCVCVCVPKTRGRSSMASNKPGIKCNNLIVVVVVVVIVILNRSGGEIFKEWYHRAKECAIRGEFLLAVLFFSFSASRPNDTQTESLRSIHSLLLSCYKCIKAHRNFRSAPYS